MCFSATASFAAGGGLFIIGAAAISQSRTLPQRVFAFIPVVFAVQQVCEGIVWLSFSNPGYANFRQGSMYTFLVFAQCVWPVLVPLSMLLFEKDPLRKKMLASLLAAGIITSIYLCQGLLRYPVNVFAGCKHITYQLDFPENIKWLSDVGYMLSAVMSPFICGVKPVRFFGWTLLASYLFTSIIYTEYLASVWCFFAAVLSAVILLIIKQLRNGEDVKQ
jgi:hypothetical protein